MNRRLVSLVAGFVALTQFPAVLAQIPATAPEEIKIAKFPEVILRVEKDGEKAGGWWLQVENRMRWKLHCLNKSSGPHVDLFRLREGKWENEPAFGAGWCGNWSEPSEIPSGETKKLSLTPPTLDPKDKTFRNPGIFCILILVDDGTRMGYATSPAYELKDGKLVTVHSAPPLLMR